MTTTRRVRLVWPSPVALSHERRACSRTDLDAAWVTVERRGPALRFGLGGELDEENHRAVVETVQEHLQRDLTGDGAGSSPATSVVLDLRSLRLLTAAGIAGLVELRELVVTAGATFTIERPQPIVERALAITGMLEHLGHRDRGASRHAPTALDRHPRRPRGA
jgi:anti-anti-sigma factor